jgi:hypothetical protein
MKLLDSGYHGGWNTGQNAKLREIKAARYTIFG